MRIHWKLLLNGIHPWAKWHDFLVVTVNNSTARIFISLWTVWQQFQLDSMKQVPLNNNSDLIFTFVEQLFLQNAPVCSMSVVMVTQLSRPPIVWGPWMLSFLDVSTSISQQSCFISCLLSKPHDGTLSPALLSCFSCTTSLDGITTNGAFHA